MTIKLRYEVKSTRNITPDEFKMFFSKLFFSNKQFSEDYFVRLMCLNRPTICVYLGTMLVGCMILKKVKRTLKISAVSSILILQGEHIVKSLLKIAQDFVDNEFSEFDNCYITINPNNTPEQILDILSKLGYQITTVRANGDYIYTYAKSI